MTTVTQLQAAMLVKIAEDLMTPRNGAEPNCIEETETWADGIIEDAEDKGVFTSLLNAKLVWHSGKGREAGVGLTAEGFAIYKAGKNAERDAAVAETQPTPIEVLANALQAAGLFIIDVLVPEQCLTYCMADGKPIHVTAEAIEQ